MDEKFFINYVSGVSLVISRPQILIYKQNFLKRWHEITIFSLNFMLPFMISKGSKTSSVEIGRTPLVLDTGLHKDFYFHGPNIFLPVSQSQIPTT